ncbi:MAG: hypothetical protein M3Z32_08290 [Acidobacteriota bacterium]|nr:hypothetical protein [Acidobacteriota bacterium]
MKTGLTILALTFCAGAIAQAPVPIAYRIDAFAGANPIADRVNAREEYLGQPESIAADSKGNVYYADGARAVVRKVSSDGIITTVAGNGRSGYSGDGGPATAAEINGDAALAVDGADNLYIADTYNMRVRKVTADGKIDTIAGNGLSGSSGDGGPAKLARFGVFNGMAVDQSGNVYTASGDGRIRRISTDGIVQTVAGTGVSGFSGDGGLATQARIGFANPAVDGEGNLLVLDSSNYRIRKVSVDGTIQTIAGTGVPGNDGNGGPAVAAKIGVVADAKPDGKGGLYIAELSNNRVRHIRADGVIEAFAGKGTAGYSGDGGPAAQGELNYPWFIATGPDGSVFIAEAFNNVIRRVAPDGTLSTLAGRERYAGDGGYASDAILNDAVGVALDNQGNVFVSENWASGRIRKIDVGGVISTFASGLAAPGMLAADQSGNIYYVDGSTVWRGSPDGTLARIAGTLPGVAPVPGSTSALQTRLAGPQGLAVDSSGTVYIADTSNNIIRKVAPDGTIQTIAGTGAAGFAGDGGPAISARFNGPEGLAFDSAGNLYVADHFNYRVRRISTDGSVKTVAGTGLPSVLDNGWPEPQGDGGPATLAQLFGPERVAVDATGSIFIGEHGNGPYIGNRIRRVTPDGIIDTVAGTGDYGYQGDGGLARDAQLHYVSQLASEANGKIYFADRYNFKVRVLTPLYGSLTPQGSRRAGGRR